MEPAIVEELKGAPLAIQSPDIEKNVDEPSAQPPQRPELGAQPTQRPDEQPI